ncbi:ZYRO0D04730p [Zygosaccharomyces rouxii]|uniref:ZYRO0D04730p n=1 Tax=Zygosaccharomyces rouxii (strain ATCC 2623 / CBS 732 / NBRC 1130 / NCYC 568 / NRRL Y-229) TaxID=559307 RepID=C5DV86_ZYGRC|nr:uncharacterized protein ZYRO0D04730g [Zygosaccharomyces rouxii]CAR27705.1 ZYRO0D04730p [Zygosaccharomyces rouxii]
MRPFPVNVVVKRGFSMDVGKIARDILIADRSTSERNNPRLNHLHRNNARDSITDKWLKKALTRKQHAYMQNEVTIYSPVVLKTLQKLRSTDNTSAYFTLLNKIRVSDITWISQNGSHIRNREEVPIEFYHEVSNMIYRMSLNCSDFKDFRALANFSITLMSGYNQLIRSSSNSQISHETKFYKNCLLVVIKSESIAALLDAFKEMPPRQNGLKPLAELVFYHQTGQFIKLLEFLEEFILTSLAEKSITGQQIKAFSTPLLNILQSCLLNGEEQICCTFLKKLKRKWNFKMDEHSYVVLKELCERMGMDQVLLTLAGNKQDLRTKIARKNMSWSEYINFLHQSQIDLFEEELPFDYSQSILSSVGPTIQDWKAFIDSNPLPEGANDSLRTFYFNSILVDLATRKNIGFMLSMLEFLVYKREFCQYLIYSHKLIGSTKSSGFHALVKSISNSNSSKITAYTLHDFLQKHYPDIGFQFNDNDYYHLMKACAYKADRHTIYYFLYHYLKNQGHTLYTGAESVDWRLPHRISLLLNQINNPKLNKRINEIEKNAKDLFTERRLNGSQVKDDDIRRLFGENYSPRITTKTLLSMDAVGDQLEDLIRNQSVYSLSIDLEYSERLSNCLSYTITHSSPVTS